MASSTPTIPSWAKAVAIIQICLGILGIFMQFYKIIIPVFARLKNIAASEFIQQDVQMQRDFTTATKLIDLNESQASIITLLGITGLILCIIYIIAGVKMLKPLKANYNFSKYLFIAFIIFNLINIAYFSSSQGNILIIGIMVYVIIGLALDTTLLIIGLTSDKNIYGIHSKSASVKERDKDDRLLNVEEVY
jgi:hypothetical protein